MWYDILAYGWRFLEVVSSEGWYSVNSIVLTGFVPSIHPLSEKVCLSEYILRGNFPSEAAEFALRSAIGPQNYGRECV